MKSSFSEFDPLISVDRSDPQPLHRQIYNAFRSAILERRLRPGQRIPSTRALGAELGVSRFPVLNAYAQLLAEGYFEARVGAGTVVSSLLPEEFTSRSPKHLLTVTDPSGPRPVSKRTPIYPNRTNAPWLTGLGAFGVGQVAFDQFPQSVWSNLVARHCRKMDQGSLHYGNVMGSKALRKAISTYLSTARSLRCDADQIMIVSGSQQALEISARVLFDPGSSVWLEDPGYFLARNVFDWASCSLVPVPVDREGLDVAAGIRLCRDARAAYVTPSHQFPLGHTMSATRRLQLLDWAQHSGSWLIEDDYDSEFRYESPPIASLQGLDTHERVIYIGTFSKVLFPSLRLGYVVIPADLVDRFRMVRRSMDIGPPTLFQDVLTEFIIGGHFARHIRTMRSVYRERRSALVECIHKELGPVAEIVGSEAGLHLTVILPNGSHDVELAERAARQGLWVWPLSLSYLGKEPLHGFILGFGYTSVAEIPPAVQKLSAILASAAPSPV